MDAVSPMSFYIDHDMIERIEDSKTPLFHQFANYAQDVLNIDLFHFNKLNAHGKLKLIKNQNQLRQVENHKMCELKVRNVPATNDNIRTWMDIVEMVKWVYENPIFIYQKKNQTNNAFLFYEKYSKLLNLVIQNQYGLKIRDPKCARHNIPIQPINYQIIEEDLSRCLCSNCGSYIVSRTLFNCPNCGHRIFSKVNSSRRTDLCIFIENQNQKAISIVAECCFDNNSLLGLAAIIVEYANDFMKTYNFEEFIYSENGKTELQLIQTKLKTSNDPKNPCLNCKTFNCRNFNQSIASCFSLLNDQLISFIRIADEPIDNNQFIHTVSKITYDHLPLRTIPFFRNTSCSVFSNLLFNLKHLGLFVIRLSRNNNKVEPKYSTGGIRPKEMEMERIIEHGLQSVAYDLIYKEEPI